MFPEVYPYIQREQDIQHGIRRIPVVVSAPHGRYNFPDNMPNLRYREGISSEDHRYNNFDPWTDNFAQFFSLVGATAVIFPFSRVYLNVNGWPDEYKESKEKYIIGDGLLETHLDRGENQKPLFEAPITKEDLQQRLRLHFWPYHQTIADKLKEIREKFGRALLLDVHSYYEGERKDSPDIVLGWRYVPRTCDKDTLEEARSFFANKGFSVEINSREPILMWGGFTVFHHGSQNRRNRIEARQNRIEALQIEIRRGLYRTHLSDFDARATMWEERTPPVVPNIEGLEKLLDSYTEFIQHIGNFIIEKSKAGPK